uniref:Uncharacterized protein n=1 Tax=Arundo donax TaxID=35708 RepID=A0A0A9FGQ7_ARUDO
MLGPGYLASSYQSNCLSFSSSYFAYKMVVYLILLDFRA